MAKALSPIDVTGSPLMFEGMVTELFDPLYEIMDTELIFVVYSNPLVERGGCFPKRKEQQLHLRKVLGYRCGKHNMLRLNEMMNRLLN